MPLHVHHTQQRAEYITTYPPHFLDRTPGFTERHNYPRPSNCTMRLRRLLPVAILLSSVCTLATAANDPLSTPELSACAERVEQLRTRSPELIERNAAHDRRRSDILARRRALDAQSMALGPDDLKGSLDLQIQRKALNKEALALNHEVQALRNDIAANSRVRDAYDQRCARRPYTRSDFAKLTPEQQQAMRVGLSDIQIPELPRNLPPLQGVTTR